MKNQTYILNKLFFILSSLLLFTSGCLNAPSNQTVTDSSSTVPTAAPVASIIPSPVAYSPQIQPRVTSGQVKLQNNSTSVSLGISTGNNLQSDGKVSVKFGKSTQ